MLISVVTSLWSVSTQGCLRCLSCVVQLWENLIFTSSVNGNNTSPTQVSAFLTHTTIMVSWWWCNLHCISLSQHGGFLWKTAPEVFFPSVLLPATLSLSPPDFLFLSFPFALSRSISFCPKNYEREHTFQEKRSCSTGHQLEFQPIRRKKLPASVALWRPPFFSSCRPTAALEIFGSALCETVVGRIGAFLVMITEKLYLGFVFLPPLPLGSLQTVWPGSCQEEKNCSQQLIAILCEHECKYSEISISTNIANQQRLVFSLEQELTSRDRNVLSLLYWFMSVLKKEKSKHSSGSVLGVSITVLQYLFDLVKLIWFMLHSW